MMKELFLAIALGALLGFGITGSFLSLNKNKSNNPTTNQVNLSPTPINSSTEIPTPTLVASKENNSLAIETPENESIVSNSKLNIKGTAYPNSLIIIKDGSKIYNTNTNSEGDFDVEINLESGANSIQITAVDDKNDLTSETELLVTYSTAKI